MNFKKIKWVQKFDAIFAPVLLSDFECIKKLVENDKAHLIMIENYGFIIYKTNTKNLDLLGGVGNHKGLCIKNVCGLLLNICEIFKLNFRTQSMHKGVIKKFMEFPGMKKIVNPEITLLYKDI